MLTQVLTYHFLGNSGNFFDFWTKKTSVRASILAELLQAASEASEDERCKNAGPRGRTWLPVAKIPSSYKVVPPQWSKLVYNPNNYRYNPLINPNVKYLCSPTERVHDLGHHLLEAGTGHGERREFFFRLKPWLSAKRPRADFRTMRTMAPEDHIFSENSWNLWSHDQFIAGWW